MILIAPDKFKDTFSADEVCTIIADSLRSCGVEQRLVLRPMADGGEGSQQIVLRKPESICRGVYFDSETAEACVVSADVVGFSSFPPDMPLTLRTSHALGEAILKAAQLSPSVIYVCVGGTATCDAGMGMLSALGAKISDTEISLDSLAQLPPIVGIIDVKAQLVGGRLSALDFAPQKALPGEDISELAPRLEQIQRIVGRQSEYDGAGGGIGFALCSVLGCECRSGAEFAASRLDFNNVKLVITGEGRLDKQTYLGGKLADRVYNAATTHNVPCIIIPGCMDGESPYPHVFPSDIYACCDFRNNLVCAVKNSIPLINKLLQNNHKNICENIL